MGHLASIQTDLKYLTSNCLVISIETWENTFQDILSHLSIFRTSITCRKTKYIDRVELYFNITICDVSQEVTILLTTDELTLRIYLIQLIQRCIEIYCLYSPFVARYDYRY